MMKHFILLMVGILAYVGNVSADDQLVSAEGQAPLRKDRMVLAISDPYFPKDSSVVSPKKRKPEQPSYEPGVGLLTFWIGVIAMCSGYFSPVGILIAGGVFAVIGLVLLLLYIKLKDTKPFQIRGRNILAKILLAIFFFFLLLALIGAIIMAFVVALALLLAAILSSVVSPVVVAGVIMGIGVAWMLTAAVVYLIKYRRYKKSLKNG